MALNNDAVTWKCKSDHMPIAKSLNESFVLVMDKRTLSRLEHIIQKVAKAYGETVYRKWSFELGSYGASIAVDSIYKGYCVGNAQKYVFNLQFLVCSLQFFCAALLTAACNCYCHLLTCYWQTTFVHPPRSYTNLQMQNFLIPFVTE